VIIDGAIRAIRRLGPVRVTLADVAREVGLAPATLLQRFGSKRGLLLAVAEQEAHSVEAFFAGIRAAHRSPLDAMVAAAAGLAHDVDSPESLANLLAFHAIDLGDPQFHCFALDRSRRVLAAYCALIEGAVAAGELAPCSVPRLARSIHAVAGGSLINWSVHRDGALVHWLREDIDTLLAPHRRDARMATPLADLPSPVSPKTRSAPRAVAGPRARHAAADDAAGAPRTSRPLPRP
jgi:AcrR family transcriptional regulator